MGAEHKKLGVPGEEELGGRGVSYCATCDAAFYKDRTTIIVGGGDSAMEEAIFLAKFSSKVTIVNRRDEFRASKIMLERARATENIEFLTPYVVEEFLAGENGVLDRAELRNTETGEKLELPMSGAFIAIGHEPQSEIVDGIVETDDEGYVKTEGKSTRTNVPGVFAAGDLVRPHLPPGRHRRRLRLSGRAGRRVVPARQPRRPDAGGPRRHRRPGRGAVGAGRPLLAAALAAAALAGCGGDDEAEAERSPHRAGHDQVLLARTSRTAARCRPRTRATARASRRRSCGVRSRPARSSWCSWSRTRTRPTAPSPTGRPDGIAAAAGAGLAPDGQFPAGVKEGKNSAGKDGWTPPCPPEGDDAHRYVFARVTRRTGTLVPETRRYTIQSKA